MKKIINNRNGFTLIEVFIALFIFSVGVLGVLSMKTKAVVDNGSSRQQAVASELCVSVLERLMMCDYRDDPANPGSNTGDPLIDAIDPGDELTPVPSNGSGGFGIRYSSAYSVNYRVTEVSPTLRHIRVEVTWPRHTGNRAMVMESVIPRDSLDI